MNQKGFAPLIIFFVVTAVAYVVLTSNKPNNSQAASIHQSLLKEVSQSAAPTLTPTASPSAKPTASASATQKLVPTPQPKPQPVVNNTPPDAGFSSQIVSVDGQNFPVSIIAADLNTTKVIVDTASESDCGNNCPALPLADYVSRSGAYAGINGSFFCPSEYPSCKDKTNSFDTLLMNRNKHYFNSDNNVYSVVPAMIFYSGGARSVGKSLEWGRDSSVDAVIANYPQLVVGGNIAYSENPAEPKFGQKGARTFIGYKGNIVYIGVVSNATMGDSAKVLHALGIQEALNLDEGGSTALWFGGYKFGPGRNIPNAVLFLKR